tara:strand:+ start:255 stop:668 length:414 start_codon:yes stop_codon:yes gene_type:complete
MPVLYECKKCDRQFGNSKWKYERHLLTKKHNRENKQKIEKENPKQLYMSQLHYSYLYGDGYFYGTELVKMIDEIEIEREELRKDRLLTTSFANDLKNRVMGLPRDLHFGKPKDKEYNIKGTIYKNGIPVPADDVGRV